MIDLVGELMAAQAALGAGERRLLPAPILNAALLGMVGCARITLDADGTMWEPGDSLTYIIPCRIDRPDTPESDMHELVPMYGSLVDLVAWHPEFPDRWALRTGNAGWLGACEPQMMGGRMLVRRNPMAWLKAGCDGVVALSPFWQERQRLLALADTLIAEDFEHAQKLRQLMERPSYVPNVKVGNTDVSRTRTVEA